VLPALLGYFFFLSFGINNNFESVSRKKNFSYFILKLYTHHFLLHLLISMQESSDKNKPQSESHNIPSKGLLGFSPTLTSIDQFSPNSAFAISSPGRPPSIPKSLAIPSSSPVVLGRSHEDASSITGLGDRKNSTDDLAAEVGFTPVNTASDARLLYRQWRTGSHIGADIDQVNYSESSGSFEEKVR
jgi:hypothetical protein